MGAEGQPEVVTSDHKRSPWRYPKAHSDGAVALARRVSQRAEWLRRNWKASITLSAAPGVLALPKWPSSIGQILR